MAGQQPKAAPAGAPTPPPPADPAQPPPPAPQPAPPAAPAGAGPAADIARLGEPAPGATPDGAAGGYWAGDGVEAWLTTEDGDPVGYLRDSTNPDIAVRIRDAEAWAAIVDKLGLTPQDHPPADGKPPAPADNQGQPGGAGAGAATDGTSAPAPAATPPPEGKAVTAGAVQGRMGRNAPAASDPDDDTEQTGIMVALMVPAGEGNDLAVDHDRATPPDEMHITLATLGDTKDVPDAGEFVAKLLEAVRDVAGQYDDVTGVLNGIGRWWTPDGDCFYLSFDSPALPDLRHDLFEALEDVGLQPDTDHGFSPHMTLAYLGEGEDTPMRRLEPKELGFPAVSVVFGDARIDVPLTRTGGDNEDVILVRGDIPDSTAPSVQLKAKGGPPIAAGAYVSWPDGKGRVDMIVTNGKVPGVEEDVEGTADAPAARVVVYAQTGGTWRATGRKIGRKVAALKRNPPLKGGMKSLTELLEQHAADAADRGVAPVEAKTLQEVWSRGREAWPGPDVGGEQDAWASGRAEAFLAKALGGPVPAAYVGDDDLLPQHAAPQVDLSDEWARLRSLRSSLTA